MKKYKMSAISRRTLLKWSPPIVTAITLPAHASMSPCSCEGPPVLTVVSIPKCAGDPPVGTAVIEISVPGECDMEIKSLEFATNDDKSSLGSLPNFPLLLTPGESETFTWIGPASDAVTCLPLAQITATIEYCCEDLIVLTEEYDITQLLVDSVP